MDLGDLNFLVVGQLKTSRTETLEGYLRGRAHSLGVIGLMSPFASYNESRCTFYSRGMKTKEFSLPSFSIKHITWWNYPLICVSYAIYVIAVIISAFSLHCKFDYFIGIATFSALLGMALKKLGMVDKVIYYCLDYYPSPDKPGFAMIINVIFKKVDKWLVKNADFVWELSERIAEARSHYGGVSAGTYKSLVVPLGYTDEVKRDCPFEKRERWTLGFVGTLSENQGLQMVVKAMPFLIAKFPQIKVRIIGHGPYASSLKEMVSKSGFEDRFIFHGFIRKDTEVYDILSRCMAGLATWTGEDTDNALYTDPGKPKLYALLGLPIIITSASPVSQLIAQTKAGEVISYRVEDFVQAVEKILANDETFKVYLEGTTRFKPYCLANSIFDKGFLETLKNNSKKGK